jgi:hypothetical protein
VIARLLNAIADVEIRNLLTEHYVGIVDRFHDLADQVDHDLPIVRHEQPARGSRRLDSKIDDATRYHKTMNDEAISWNSWPEIGKLS